MPTTHIAFVGFRHPHINDMYNRCLQRDDVKIVGACEEDAATRDNLAKAASGGSGAVNITHDSFDRMLGEVNADVVAIGDYYAKRGPLALKALEHGKHVIADKPLCTNIGELDHIERLARENGKVVSLMLDMRDTPVFIGVRQLILAGEIGPVRAISYGGQHPLNYGTRAGWYFEAGKHGGTLNDIAIHAIDMIPWATGKRWVELECARCWHHLPAAAPHFKGCGQVMMQLEGGAGVLGDVSYLSPDSFGYGVPFYWRFNIWGDGGMIEAGYNSKAITLYKAGEKEPRQVPLPAGNPGGYLESFLREVRGEADNLHLPSSDALRAARIALLAQNAADHGHCRIKL